MAKIYISREQQNGITQELVKEIWDYKNGVLYWKKSNGNNCKINQIAGYVHFDKKRNIKRHIVKFNRIPYKRSRIIFLWHNGWIPEEIDHIDVDSLNDNIENLRPSTRIQNVFNRKPVKNKKLSKYIGVRSYTVSSFKEKKLGIYRIKWQSFISVNQKRVHLGNFNTEIEAALFYNKMAVKHRGEFAFLNIIQP